MIKKEWGVMRRRKVEEVRKLKQSEKYRAAQKIYAVASRLFTKAQRETLTTLSDAKAFKKMKASTAQKVNEIALGLTAEANLLGVKRRLEELTATTTAAVRDFPYLSMALLRKKGTEIRKKMMQRKMGKITMRADNRVEDGGAAEEDIKEMNALEGEIRDPIMKEMIEGEIQDAVMREVNVYVVNRWWWNKHWPRLEQASKKMDDAFSQGSF